MEGISEASRWFVSVRELARELGVSEKSIRRAYWKGELRVVKVCHMLRIDRRHALAKFEKEGMAEKGRLAGRVGASRSRRTAATRPRLVRLGRNSRRTGWAGSCSRSGGSGSRSARRPSMRS